MDKPVEIPGYTILEKQGEGGMTQVYQGVSEEKERIVAIKVLEPELHDDKTLTQRFFQEAKTVSALDHENIIRVYDYGHRENYFFMVMENLEESLQDRMDEACGNCLIPQELDTIKQVAAGLDYAHRRGIIHRDIKPENIMFRTDGTAVIVDFGLAKVRSAARKLTRTGITVGSPAYMSPEQIQGLELDGRADLYSLGVIFYELLVGKPPYKAMDYLTLARMHLKKKVPRLPRKSREFQDLLDRMMAKERDERITDGAELIELLQNL